MKKSMWKVLSLVLVLTLVFAMSACAKKEDPKTSPSASSSASASASAGGEREGYTIGMVTKSLATPFFVNVKDGAEAYIAEHGIAADKMVTLDSNRDNQKELANTEDLVNQKVDAILLICLDYEGSAASVNVVKDRSDIPLIIVDAPCKNSDKADATVSSDNYDAGVQSMTALAEAMGKKGRLVIMMDTTNTPARDRIAGVKDTLKKYPDIELIREEDGCQGVDKSMEIFNNIMQAEQEIDGLWCYCDPTAQGAIAAADSAGKAGDILVAAVDGTAEGKKLIEDGKQLGSAAQFPYQLGYKGCEAAYKILAGEKLAEKKIIVDVAWIDKDNLEEYKDKR
nr:substrate-binding domain-containing protein [Maliibacterium massiliense]